MYLESGWGDGLGFRLLGLGYSNPESGKGLGFRLQALGFRV